MHRLGENICTNFGQVGMHTRSSESIDSQLQDYVTPVPVLVRSCKLKLDKTVKINSGSYTDGHTDAHVGDVGTYKIVVTNTGSQPLNVTTDDTKCGTLYSDEAATIPVVMPQA